ncbi:receptor-type tyrosine-protein phosphatase F-like isoform X2 [Scylla paramamosain]|uniref:receptor-type tyrosine-protein phosphatase F-like isoform X2 n=1 Tax=Scylla paramamosain TaxID=85552 RepID=UPI0030835268
MLAMGNGWCRDGASGRLIRLYVGGGDVLGDEAARNVSLVIKYKWDWYGNYKPLSAFCMTSSHQSLSITGLPMGTYVNPSYDTKDSYKTAILSNLYNILGVTCSTRGNQPVISPLIHAQALLTPDRRKVTLNKGEDLQLQLSSYYHITSVKWRKESSQNPAWETATLTWDRKLTIPSNKLKGSGLYSVVPQSWNGELTAEQYGVFVVVVRECPAQRYGRECEEWCPDCLHGGECDATSGECLCPAGVMGHRCQTRCNDSFIGSNCAVPLQTAEPKGQVVCTGGLMGCTCAPGYHGKKCEHECPDGRWGVDCKQTCSECERKCSSSNCESCSLWGHCKGTETRLCGQGDLGLPRLRQPPSVSSETPHGAIVSFTAWKPDYDDGELPPGGTILYYLNLTSDTNTGTTIPVNATSTELFNLTPDTTYHVKVLAAVMVNGRQCDAGSDRRGRVHTATFTTLPCPAPPQPETFTSVVPSNTSLDVQWQEVNYEDGCDHYYYYLLITPDASGKHRYRLNNHKKKVEGLQANTEYTISLQTCDQKWKHCSSFLNTTSRTLPGNLFIYKDQVSQDDHVLIRWRAASGNINNLKFRTKYSYEIEPEGYAAPSSWSHWNSNRSRLIEVFPFSVLQMLVQAKNDEGEGQVWTKKFTIPPSEPGQVRDLSVESGINFLTLKWEKPDDKPRKGILESFKVSWSEIDKRNTDCVILSASRRQYIIRNLNFNTEYWITIQAKNQNVLQDGAVTTITATTDLPVPRRIKNLKAEGTESSLTLTWREPSRQNNLIIYYRVLLYNASGVLQQNITVEESQAELEGLSHSQQYLVKVAACNKRYCSPVETLEQPAPPRLQETVNLVASNDTTITILMPLLSNPPGTHTVVVQREGREQPTQDWKEALKDKAMALLKEGGVRSQLPPMQVEADGTEVYIAAKVEQEGDERLKVTVGGGTTAGHLRNPALHKDAAYWVVVVTEKRNGGYVVRVTSTPRRFVASTSTFPGWIVGLFGLAALAIVAAAMVLCRRKCRGRSAEGRVIVGTPDSLPQPVDAALPMAPINAGQTNNCTEDIYSNATHQVKLKDIEGYLLRAVMSRDTKIEFENVPSFLCNAYTESSRPENRSKNRYRNKVPYDDTRVILPLHNHVPHSDYINANYVQSPTRTAAFIAAEGPMQETVGAFWRMVWHTNCPTVLMVANLMEGKKVKVAQYWPEQYPWTVEGVTVTPTDVTVKMDFVIRTFTISVGSVNRKVSQYQYTAWPDHGVPSMPYGLAQMIKLVRSEHAHHKPVAVHCSAGIGRTGTVILVMYLLDELQAHGAITPVEALTTLRRGRGRLVENSEQYIFAHQVLHEILFGMDTSYQCHSFQENLTALYAQLSSDASSPLNRQYQKLQSLPKDLSFIYGKDPTCAHLNRHQDILPADSRLVMVQGEGQGTDSHYLNVIRINTVDRKDAYLAGEHPQRHTLGKMWRLVYERSVAVWVLLHSFPGNDPEFPDVACESSEMLGNMTLKVGPTQAFQNFYERQVDISVKSLGRVNNHKCLLLSLRGWPATDCLPASPEPLLAVIERMEALCSLNQPPLFTCKDGVTGCGVMAALLLAVSRTKLMQQVDIYRSVASVQQDRPQFVVNLEQYIFLHSAMAAFLTSNNQYGNFA